ncbi:PKD-like domain-containing protein, partial [Flavobacterium suncheonense]|uniref:PKD-like domain-containing protein n=1 Tax=Flavobacterium suncheonense TaxID=350894 RepID=UPI003FA3814A
LTINSTTGEIDLATSTPGTYTVTYTVAASGCAPSNSSTASITITPMPSATISYATPFCNTSLSETVTLNGTGAYTGGTYSSTPGLVIDATTGDINPNASTSGTYTVTYTVPASGGCPSTSASTSITINAQPTAGADGGTVVCDNSTAAIDLFSLITGEQAGGTWVRTSGTGGAFNAAAGTFTPSAGATTSIFEYTVNGVTPCSSDVSIATITINAQPTAGNDGSTTVCENSTAAIDLYSLISGEQTGGNWVRLSGTGGVFNAAAGTFTPSVGATTSTFEYTVNGVAPCSNDASTAIVNINAQPTAGSDGSIVVCDNDTTTIDLFSLITGEQAGGTWVRTSGTGGIFNAAAGTYLPAIGATSSTFEYTVNGIAPCANDTSIASVTINPQPNVIATPASQTICSNTSTGINLSSGVAGTTYSWTVVQNGVTGASNGSGGVINQTLTATGSAIGTVTYTITPTANGCIGNPINVVITVNPLPDVIATPTSETLCSGQVTGITLTSGMTGTTYSWTASATGVSGATNGSGTVINDVLTATGTTTGNVVYTITPLNNGCSGTPVNVVVMVTPKAILTATPLNQQICSGSSATINLSSNMPNTVYNWSVNQTGVTGASSGLNVNTTSINHTLTLVDPFVQGVVVYTITPIVNSCPGDPVQVTVTVKPIPNVTANPDQQTICSQETTNISLTSSVPGTTYSWMVLQNGVIGAMPGSGTAIQQTLSTVSFVPGTVDYVITPFNGGCAGTPITVTVTVNPKPQVIGSSSYSICSGEFTTISLTSFVAGTTFSWTVVQNGVTGAFNDSSTGDITQQLHTTGSGVGTVVYTVIPTANGCAGAPFTVTVHVKPLPVSAMVPGTVCIDSVTGEVLSTHLLDTGLNTVDYDFTWYFNGVVIPGAMGSTYVASAPGDYSVDIINTNTGCTSDPAAVENTVTVVESNPGILMQMYVNEAFSNNPTITVVVSGTGVYQYQIDGGVPQSSNVFTGILPGLHTIVVTDENGCTYIEDTIYVIGYPHFFTPNGDGFNDTWNVWDLSDDQPNAEILIFDRYGKLIKQIIPGGSGWNGTYNGEPLPSTDYWFTIRFKDGPNLEERLFKAHFSLKR